MNLERFCLKFFARPGADINDAVFIDIFQEWIRLKKLSGVLLDVVDYRHVPEGPGIMLITHDINFALDYSEGRFGLLAQRKRGPGLTLQERILELVRASVVFGALLETDPRLAGRLRLEGGAFHYIANDRLAAPNTGATSAVLQPDLQAAATLLYPGQTVSISRWQNDPRARLTVLVKADAPVDMAALLDRVGVVA